MLGGFFRWTLRRRPALRRILDRMAWADIEAPGIQRIISDERLYQEFSWRVNGLARMLGERDLDCTETGAIKQVAVMGFLWEHRSHIAGLVRDFTEHQGG